MKLPSIRTQYIQEVLKDSPVGFWPLDDAAGFAKDWRSGTSLNPGTLNGTYTLGQPGPFAGAGAWKGDGSTGYISIGTTSTFVFNRNFSIEAWGYYLVDQAIITHGYPGWYLRFQNKGIELVHSQTAVIASGGSSPTNVWVHAVATVSSGSTATVNLYMNGKRVANTTTTQSFTAGSWPVMIGCEGTGTATIRAEFSQNPMSMVTLYQSELAPSRILARYNIATGKVPGTRIYSIPSGGRVLRSKILASRLIGGSHAA